MGLTKRQSRIISVVLLVSFFTGTVLLIKSRTNEEQTSIPAEEVDATSSATSETSSPLASVPSPAANTTPSSLSAPAVGEAGSFSVDLNSPGGAQMVLKNFKRNVTKDGKIKWSITADEGRYRPSDGGAELKNATMVTTRKGGTVSTLRAQNGLLFSNGQDLEKADLSGKVSLEHDGLRLEAEKAIYQEREQQVTIPTHVRISTNKIDAEADSMKLNIERNVVTLKGNVVTVVKPDPRPSKGTS